MSDLIKREDAIKAFADVLDKDFPYISEETPRERIEAIPSADRPQGEWVFDSEILCSDIGVYSAGYRCSVCGKDYFKVNGMRFCPTCGAQMKGADDGEDIQSADE